MTANDNDKAGVLSEIDQFYTRYDDLFSGVETMDTYNSISEKGLSLLDDIEFYLAHPEYHNKFEDMTLQLLKDFSLSIL
ncbi:MAG: hypothetical protein JKY85_03990 [Porticoccus sp.]|nr:hypothetical protein [Porticoccus sp.]MBL4854182.1 hypothetical protein [Robiginitomaculum sp.]